MAQQWQAPALLFVSSAALLAGALGFQYIGGFQPCDMCVWQRYGHIGVILVSAAALLLKRDVWSRLAILAMLAASGLGLWHMGVEQRWWEGVSRCSTVSTASVSDMMATIGTPLVRCTDIPWSWLGLSMAGWNMLLSAVAAAAAIFLLINSRKARV